MYITIHKIKTNLLYKFNILVQYIYTYRSDYHNTKAWFPAGKCGKGVPFTEEPRQCRTGVFQMHALETGKDLSACHYHAAVEHFNSRHTESVRCFETKKV